MRFITTESRRTKPSSRTRISPQRIQSTSISRIQAKRLQRNTEFLESSVSVRRSETSFSRFSASGRRGKESMEREHTRVRVLLVDRIRVYIGRTFPRASELPSKRLNSSNRPKTMYNPPHAVRVSPISEKLRSAYGLRCLDRPSVIHISF